MKILVLNSGSSSQKTCLYEIGEALPEDTPVCLWKGKVEWDGKAVSSRAQAVERLLAGVLPLHNQAELEGMELAEKLLGSIPQVAVFDTGYHRTIPLAAAIYPGPYEWFENGIRRYGFHGINHQYCAARAAR